MIIPALKIFLIGILESFFYSFNTKTIQKNMQFLSFLVSVVSVFLWYYVIMIVVENINNFWLILAYGCANGLGDIITIRFDRYIDRIEERILSFFRRFRFPCRESVKSRIPKRKRVIRKRGKICPRLSV